MIYVYSSKRTGYINQLYLWLAFEICTLQDYCRGEHRVVGFTVS
jgi:hypothetical protein